MRITANDHPIVGLKAPDQLTTPCLFRLVGQQFYVQYRYIYIKVHSSGIRRCVQYLGWRYQFTHSLIYIYISCLLCMYVRSVR